MNCIMLFLEIMDCDHDEAYITYKNLQGGGPPEIEFCTPAV